MWCDNASSKTSYPEKVNIFLSTFSWQRNVNMFTWLSHVSRNLGSNYDPKVKQPGQGWQMRFLIDLYKVAVEQWLIWMGLWYERTLFKGYKWLTLGGMEEWAVCSPKPALYSLLRKHCTVPKIPLWRHVNKLNMFSAWNVCYSFASKLFDMTLCVSFLLIYNHLFMSLVVSKG